jgi:fumarate hydratase class II
MLVTALNEILGYDNCAKIAKYAYEHDISLKEACITLKLLNAAEFEQHIDPSKMISPSE